MGIRVSHEPPVAMGANISYLSAYDQARRQRKQRQWDAMQNAASFLGGSIRNYAAGREGAAHGPPSGAYRAGGAGRAGGRGSGAGAGAGADPWLMNRVMAQPQGGNLGFLPPIPQDVYQSLTPTQRKDVDQLSRAIDMVASDPTFSPAQRAEAIEKLHGRMIDTLTTPSIKLGPDYPQGQGQGQFWQAPTGAVYTRDNSGNVRKLEDSPKDKAFDMRKYDEELYMEVYEFLTEETTDPATGATTRRLPSPDAVRGFIHSMRNPPTVQDDARVQRQQREEPPQDQLLPPEPPGAAVRGLQDSVRAGEEVGGATTAPPRRFPAFEQMQQEVQETVLGRRVEPQPREEPPQDQLLPPEPPGAAVRGLQATPASQQAQAAEAPPPREQIEAGLKQAAQADRNSVELREAIAQTARRAGMTIAEILEFLHNAYLSHAR